MIAKTIRQFMEDLFMTMFITQVILKHTCPPVTIAL